MNNLNSCYEIADWLNNKDGDGASDFEFAEVFALLDLMRNGRQIPYIYDTFTVILNMDVDGLCKYLKDVLDEIKYLAEERIKER